MSKIETTSKKSLKLPSRMNLGRRGAHTELSALDTAHKLPHSLERTKPRQCSPVRSYTASIELNTQFQGLVPLKQTQILRSTRHKNLQKQSKKDFLYSCLILAYISATTNLLSSYQRNSWTADLFKPTH